MYSYEFCEIFKNTFFIERLWWLLLEETEESFKVNFRNLITKILIKARK